MKYIFFIFLICIFSVSNISADIYQPLIYDIKPIKDGNNIILSFKTDVPSYANIYIFSEQYKKDYDIAQDNDKLFNWWFEERIVSPDSYYDIFNNTIRFNNEKGILFYSSVRWLWIINNNAEVFYRYFHGSYIMIDELKREHTITITVDSRIRYMITIAVSEHKNLQCFSLVQQEFDTCIQSMNQDKIDYDMARCLRLFDESLSGSSSLPISIMYYDTCSQYPNIKTIPIIMNYTPLPGESNNIIEEKEPKLIEKIIGFIIAICFIIILIYLARKINAFKRRKK